MNENELNDLTEAQQAIACFELWQDMIISGVIPDCKRFNSELKEFYKYMDLGTHAPFNYLFMGFLGGLDFASVATQEK